MKQCSKCKKRKNESEFSKSASHKDGLRCWCKKCEREYTRKYYKRKWKPLRKYYGYEQCHRVVNGVREKRCRKCGKWKAESKFYKRRKYKGGLANRCKECANKATNKSRKRRLAVRN
ncbi:MAG: hypothetical protein ACYSR9_06650 [Planctomycetota bacterium]|jgi:hypothetical protein